VVDKEPPRPPPPPPGHFRHLKIPTGNKRRNSFDRTKYHVFYVKVTQPYEASLIHLRGIKKIHITENTAAT